MNCPRHEPAQTADQPSLLHRRQTVLQRLEDAREERGSSSLWDAVAARLDSEDRQREVVAPMLAVLDQVRERVDNETWRLLLDFERRSFGEVMTGVEIGLELGYTHGRMSALVEAEAEDVPSPAATLLVARLVDVVGDVEAEHHDVLSALLVALRATVIAARSEHPQRR